MREYIDSLENGEVLSETEWRDIIADEIADIEKQTGEKPEIDVDEVIKALDDDGYVKSVYGSFKMGERFYDEANGRYLTIDGVGVAPNIYACVVEELGDDLEFSVTSRGLFTRYELKKFKRV